MRVADKSGLDSKDKYIQLNGQKSSLFANKNYPLRHKMDAILNQDYEDWKTNRLKFNPVNSLIARNSQTVEKYVMKIYEDYKIRDPLLQGNGKPKSSILLNHGTKNALNTTLAQTSPNKRNPDAKTMNPQFWQRNAYQTPSKTQKKGLQLTNYSKQKQQKRFLSEQKIQPIQNVFLTSRNEDKTNKVQFIQRTAPSHDSSYGLNNSRNVTFNSFLMNRSRISNDLRQNELPDSRISIKNRLGKEIHSSQITRPEQHGQIPSFQSGRSFLSRRNQPTTQKKFQHQILSSQSLGQNNPQRVSQQVNKQLYALKFAKTHQLQPKTRYLEKQDNLSDSKIRESFRYCVGCQTAILEANISFHEKQCKQFQRIFKLTSVDEIITELQRKIDLITANIRMKQKQIHYEDKDSIVKSSKRLITEVQQAKKLSSKLNPLQSKDAVKQYENVMQVGKHWGLLTEEVNKLKWFLLVKQNFQQIKLNAKQLKS